MTFLKDENGQGMVEYALIVALIAIVVIVALVFVGGVVKNKMNNVGNTLENAGTEE
jgi:pilus assembly protein Flp/PilA